jgi:UTP--glucose-1-phosphate uridylyltransferase
MAHDRYEHLPEFMDKMSHHGLAPMVMDTFSAYYRQLVDGATGIIRDEDIRPLEPEEVVQADALDDLAPAGDAALKRTVRITLNGGLGTSMGLQTAKSLLEVRDGRRFLDIIMAQVAVEGIRQAFMNSFSTHAATLAALERLAPSPMPMMFLQNKFPKIRQQDLAPADWPINPELEWNPPGHGDIYTAIATSGTLERMLAEGLEYALICNSDNLGATLDRRILGYVATRQLPFLMEVARRHPLDFKGGHLAVERTSGRLILRESAQCPPGSSAGDIRIYRYFNTNNLWVRLPYLKHLVDTTGQVRLPMIVNPKSLDPRIPTSPSIFQVESAMGAAIGLFEGAQAILVPRARFLPVKKCSDLLVIRSDCYRFADGHRLASDMAVHTPDEGPAVDLDPAYYGRIDCFDARFPQGPPSLRHCQALTVRGDVLFEAGVTVRGRVTVVNRRSSQVVIRSGATLDTDIEF